METAQQEITSLERLVGAQGASPLFARLADLYLQAGRPKDALRVCDSGLANFPFYSTGHFVKGRALIALDMTNEARRELEFVRDWLPTNPTIWSYLDTLPASDEELLTAVSEPEAPTAISEESVPTSETASPVESGEQPGGFFGAITGGEVPLSAVDTGSSAAAPAEENVFGLPSEAPAGFGGFGGGTTEEAPQAFSGFGGFGGSTDTPDVAEAETTTPATEAFSGFGEPEGQQEPSSPVVEEPAVSFEDTVSNALGDGAPGFIPASVPAEATFEAYADRMRLELGPTGLITVEQFLQGDGIVPSDSSAGFSSMSVDPEPFSVSEPSPEPTNALQEEAPSGFNGPDFSGLPTVEESPTSAPAVESPAVNDDGFSGPAFEGPPADTSIEGLTEKLQSAKKITPVIDFSSKTSSESNEENPMVTSGFVTPTLAEIYAKQGWFDDAIKAYRALSKTKPAEREKFEARIAELEEEKKKE